MMPTPAPFIVGVGRSGTTLLRLMLDSHPDLAIPGETHFLIRLLDLDEGSLACEQFLRTVIETPAWRNLAVTETAFAAALAEVVPFSLRGGIRAFYRLYARRFGKDRWGDKTPPYRSCMNGIQRLLPEAHFLHVIRDGRDVALSYRGLWFGPGDDVEAQARFWVDQLRSARTQSTKLRRYAEVRYEALVTAPESTLRKICDYLELRFHPQMLDYHRFASTRLAELKGPAGPPTQCAAQIARFIAIHARTAQVPDPGRIGRWRREMSAEDRARYETIAGPLLRELGYEVSGLSGP